MERSKQGLKLCAGVIFTFISMQLFAQGTKVRKNGKAIELASLAHSSVKPLSVGDRLPDLTINNIVNYSIHKSSTAAFSNKLLILDFMATTCGSCIHALPRLDSLQTKFGDQLQILLVTYEKPEKVKSFLQKNKIGKQINLSFVAEDSLLKKHFPHEYISHVAWVNQGRVQAITGTEYIQEKNIQAILNGTKVNWPIKQEITNFDYNKPILDFNKSNFQSNNIPESLYYSTVAGHISGVADNYKVQTDSARHVIRTVMINMPIIDLYLRSWEIFRFPISHIVLEVKDKNRYIYSTNIDYRAAWEIQNTYSYEGNFPLSLTQAARGEKIRNDLNFYFGFSGRMEKRITTCYVLVRTGSDNRVPLITTSTQMNISVASLVYRMNNTMQGIPVLNDATVASELQLELDEKIIGNIVEMNKVLKQYGLRITREQREVEMFVLTEKPQTNIVSNRSHE